MVYIRSFWWRRFSDKKKFSYNARVSKFFLFFFCSSSFAWFIRGVQNSLGVMTSCCRVVVMFFFFSIIFCFFLFLILVYLIKFLFYFYLSPTSKNNDQIDCIYAFEWLSQKHRLIHVGKKFYAIVAKNEAMHTVASPDSSGNYEKCHVLESYSN